MKRLFLLLLAVFIVSCQGGEAKFPQRTEDARRAERGTIFDIEAISLFGDDDEESDLTKVDPILWKAALESVSFMPLASVDRKGGIIITDWYEGEDNKGERYKLNVLVGNKLQVGGVKVTAFKQTLQEGNWRDASVSNAFGNAIEDKIFKNAQKLKAAK